MTGEIFVTSAGGVVRTAGSGGGSIASRPAGGGGGSAPTLSSVSPSSGVDTGGTLLTLTGTHFTGATAVTLGGASVGSFTVVSDTSITFNSPAHADGAVSITVTNASGTSGSVSFTFTAPGSGVTALTMTPITPMMVHAIRSISPGTADVPVSFTYSGTPGLLKGKVLSGATTVVDVALTNLSLGSGTGTATVPGVPAGDNYTLTLHDATSGISSVDTNLWGVGVVIVAGVDSNLAGLLGSGYDPGAASTVQNVRRYRVFNQCGWTLFGASRTDPPGTASNVGNSSDIGAGMANIARLIGVALDAAGLTGTPIAMSCMGHTSSTILDNSPGGTYWTSLWAANGDGTTSAAGFASAIAPKDASIVMLLQSGGNYGAGNTVTSYRAGLDSFFNGWRTLFNRSASSLPCTTWSGPGSYVIGNNYYTGVVREGALQWVAAEKAAGHPCEILYTSADLLAYNSGTDGLHVGTNGNFLGMVRSVQTLKKLLGFSNQPGIGPYVTGSTRTNSTTVDISIAHINGTSLQTLTGSGTPTGFYFSSSNADLSTDGVGPGTGSFKTPASVSITSATSVRVTFASDPGTPLYFKYMGGNNSIAGVAYDGTHSAAQYPEWENGIYDNSPPPLDSDLTSYMATAPVLTATPGYPLQPTLAWQTVGVVGTPAPTLSSVSPSSGVDTGGTLLTLTGLHLTGATAVTLGGTPVGSFTVVSDTSITFTSPAHADGSASITVTTAGGTSNSVTFTYNPASSTPSLTSVNPTSGVDTGGTLLTLTGSHFTGATAVTLGGSSVGSFTVVSDTSITFTAPSHADGTVSITVTGPGGTSGSVSFTYGPPSSGAVFTTLGVRNGAAARTAPPVQAGHTFAPGQIPAGSYPEIRPAGSSSPVSAYQWDQVSTRKDGSWYYAVASFKADGAFAAYNSTGDTLTYDIAVKTGTPPYSTSSITPTTIASASQLYVKLYGGDFKAEIGNGTDYYYADFNYILANYPRDNWGLNPTGGWELVSSGVVGNKYWGWMCARRHSDNAIHKWLVVAFEVMVWATGEYTINPMVVQPWIYDAHPSGTLGPAANAQPNVTTVSKAQPRYAGFYELWDGRSNTLIGARGGPNDARVFTIPAANFDTATNGVTPTSTIGSYPSNLPGGGMTQSTGWIFTPASGGALPSGLDPNWVYWVQYPDTGKFGLALERAGTPGFYVPIVNTDNWTAGATIADPNVNGPQWVIKGNVGYFYVTGGVTGSTGPTPNPIGSPANATRTDGTATYQPASSPFGSPGSGNIIATPVCATFGNTAIDFKDENAQPYWFDPINHTSAPWTLPMPDFTYTTKTSRVVHPFEFHTPTPVPDTDPGIRYLGAVEKYFPNDIFTDFGQGTWDVMRAPGDDILDNRIGAWNQRQALRLYQPGDRNTAQNARVMASRFFNFHHWGWDHRTGRIPLINLGHNRAGSDYTGYPTGTINSSLTWYVDPADCVGSPVPMGVGYKTSITGPQRHVAGYTSTYGQVVNGSHCPNPSLGDRVINGDYIALQEMQAIHFGCLAYMYSYGRNAPSGFPGIGGIVNHDYGQGRANGWDTVKQCTTKIFTPDWHLMRPYYDDNVTDQSVYFAGLKTYMDANASPMLSYWGLTSPTVASIGGQVTLWSFGHQMEGMSYGAMVFGSDYPGFKIATDNYLPNLAKIWDPAQGGCLYYVGTDYIVFGSGTYASIQSDFPTLAMSAQNNGDWLTGQLNSFAQTPGGSFVCPGVGGTAPGYISSYGGGYVNYTAPGPNILDGGGLWGGQPFCSGNMRVDAAAIPIQVIAPFAVAARMPGANPIYARIWNDARTRMTVGGMSGPTFAGFYSGIGSYGSFQYCYSPT